MKAMVGLGIFILPHTTKDIGILGFAIFYPLIVYTMTFFVTFVIKAANDINYHSSSFGELHEIILGPKYRFVSEFGIFINSFVTAITLANAPSKPPYFSYNLVLLAADMLCYSEFSWFCEMSWFSWVIYSIIALLITLPFALISNLKKFVWVNSLAVIVTFTCLFVITFDLLKNFIF